MTTYLIYDNQADAIAAATAIYSALHLNSTQHKTTAWDTPRQRLDGKWIILAPPSNSISALASAQTADYSPEWFEPQID